MNQFNPDYDAIAAFSAALKERDDEIARLQKMLTWTRIADDPATLPPLEVPVFAAGGSLAGPCVLVRSEVTDHDGEPAWAWCDCDGEPYWDDKKKQWAVWDAVWDDDYQPEYWLALPGWWEVTHG